MKILTNNKSDLNKRGYLVENVGYIEPSDSRNSKFINEIKKIGSGNSVITEPLRLFVILQKYDVENANGRVYPKDILYREADKYQELIDNRGAVGESDHPESAVIAVGNVAIEVKKMWWEGKTLVGEIEIIMSPGFVNSGIISCPGDMIANLLRRGIRVGVSSRGVGSLDQVGNKLVVQDDFELICWDAVITPSTPGSYMFNKEQSAQPFMESKETDDSDNDLLIQNLNDFLL